MRRSRAASVSRRMKRTTPTRPSVQSIRSLRQERLADILGGLGRNLAIVQPAPPAPEVNRNLK